MLLNRLIKLNNTQSADMQGKALCVLYIKDPEREQKATIREINQINNSLLEHNPSQWVMVRTRSAFKTVT